MRLSAVILIAAALGTAQAQTTPACTGLCLQQLAAGTCSSSQNNGTTSISGVIYAPNGTDPLPNVTVYIPNDTVAPLPTGVQCPIVGTPPSGSPLVGAITGVDGSFIINDVPVGTNIPLVFISGKWRRQIVISTTTACTNTVVDPTQTNFPKNQSQGDIPLFAIATGSVDSVECVLRKVGIDAAEFTDPAGGGRIQFYTGSYSSGSRIDTATPTQDQLMSSLQTLNQYDVLMLPCQGGQSNSETSTELSNFASFVNNGGRVYSSHYSYIWMYNPFNYTNGPFAGVANWQVNDGSYANGTATINQTFSGGLTLAEWLQQPAIGASATQGQIAIQTLKHDLVAPGGVNPPTQSWFTLNTTNNPVMQFVFDAPLAPATNQCGRVLYNEYHVETASSGNTTFPNECNATAPMTPQEKLLEFMLFELTDQGGAATLTPTTQDFGSVPINFPSLPQTFSITNNSTFPINSPQINVTGPFSIATNNCTTILAGGTCTITLIFTPVAVGPATGTLSAAAGATSLLANLTGTGIPDLAFSIPNLNFGSVDVGATASQTFTVTNTAPGPVGVSGIVISPAGNFSYTTTCPILPARLAAGGSCTDTVIFKPTTTGPLTGTLSVTGSGATPTTLSGNGVDFTIAPTPTSGSVVAGLGTSFTTLTSPLAGFANNVTLTCVTSVPGATCTVANPSFVPASAVTSTVTLTTTSEYTVIGYSGFGGRGLLWIIGLAGGAFLLLTRRRAARSCASPSSSSRSQPPPSESPAAPASSPPKTPYTPPPAPTPSPSAPPMASSSTPPPTT